MLALLVRLLILPGIYKVAPALTAPDYTYIGICGVDLSPEEIFKLIRYEIKTSRHPNIQKYFLEGCYSIQVKAGGHISIPIKCDPILNSPDELKMLIERLMHEFYDGLNRSLWMNCGAYTDLYCDYSYVTTLTSSCAEALSIEEVGGGSNGGGSNGGLFGGGTIDSGYPVAILTQGQPSQVACRMNNSLTEYQKERLNELKNHAQTVQEHATVFFDDHSPVHRSGPYKTLGNNGQVNLPAVTTYNGHTINMIVHNHTKPLSDAYGNTEYTVTCFSATDIGYLQRLINEPTVKLSKDFIFMVIHQEASYILNINDLEKFKRSDASSNQDELKDKQVALLQTRVSSVANSGIVSIDRISREVFMDLYSNYGISLIRSTNRNSKDWTPDDKWYHITLGIITPDRRNLISPCD